MSKKSGHFCSDFTPSYIYQVVLQQNNVTICLMFQFFLQAVVLQQALHQIPNPSQEVVIRNLSARLAMQLLGIGAAFMPNQVIIFKTIQIKYKHTKES